MSAVKITYRFLFGAEERSRDYEVAMDESGRQVSPPAPTGPDAIAPEFHAWTALDHQKCAHCPLNATDFPQCPVAKNLAVVADGFKTEKSYEKVTVEVVTAERTFRKLLPLQEGLFGLFGLIMATSDCPYFTFLRPMARFHLPFSSLKETIVRSTSFYLLRQYFVAKAGGKPDLELTGFKKAYKDLDPVNLGMINRIRSIAKADAEANSIIILDGFSKLLSSQVGKGLPDLEKMFTDPAS